MKLVAIVGAGRSGTNLLAGTFEQESPDFKNLVENRYIWSYGQRDRSCDNRAALEATPKVVSYIRRFLERQSASTETVLVDKTPSNALRIPFLAAVVPEVKIINIIRDGRDNLLSRSNQWTGNYEGTASADLPPRRMRGIANGLSHAARMRKRGNLPLDRIPAMLADNVPASVWSALTGRPRLYAERVAGLKHIVRSLGLDVAAAVQWRETVMAAHVEGMRLGPDRYLELRYEGLVADPQDCWRRVLEFLGRAPTGVGGAYLKETVRAPDNAPRDETVEARLQALEAHIRPTLEYLGYRWDTSG